MTYAHVVVTLMDDSVIIGEDKLFAENFYSNTEEIRERLFNTFYIKDSYRFPFASFIDKDGKKRIINVFNIASLGCTIKKEEE